MNRERSGTAAFLLGLTLTVAPVEAQTVTGVPGTPSATTTLDGKQLPPAAAEVRWGDQARATRNSKPWWPPRVVPPKGAPNVLLIMTDDQGYGVSGAFGGVIPTPAVERVAKAGLRFTEFNSTALCSPTRAALITGRNHHSAGFGVITELSTGYPGYDSIIGPQDATVGGSSARTDTRPRGSARTTTHRGSSTASRARSTSGRREWGSSTSTASWAARPTSGRPTCSGTIRRSFRGSESLVTT